MRVNVLNFSQIANNYGKYGQKFFTPLCKVGRSLNLLTGKLRFFSNFYKQLHYRIPRKFDDRFSY